MEEEKTLLQQIRDKEQEFSRKLETVKQETDAQIAAAENERERSLRQAGISGKNTADALYRGEKQKTEMAIDRMKKEAESEMEKAVIKGKGNLLPAVDKIISYVTMD
jgi:hypothetical protein